MKVKYLGKEDLSNGDFWLDKNRPFCDAEIFLSLNDEDEPCIRLDLSREGDKFKQVVEYTNFADFFKNFELLESM